MSKPGGDPSSGISSGDAWTQDAIVGSGEEQGDAAAEVGDLVAEATGDALDQAVETQSAQLVGDGALRD